jgi:type IX secretion system PorP/SprF family membrane protein
LYNELNSEEFNGGKGQLTKSKNINLKSLEQATNKLTQAENGATYKNNPALGGLAFDMQVKSGLKTSSRSSKLKKIYRKIERMVDYPVGLINLRDPELILPESNLMSFNPAFVGGMLKSRLEFNYRNQWYGNNQNSHISSINFDTYSHQLKGGVGLQLNSEVFGNSGFSNHAVSLFYSPKVSISKNVVFEPAIKLTMGTLIGDPQNIGSNSLYELQRGVGLKSPDLGSITGTSTLWYKDFGAGFVLNTKWFYVGFSADNLAGHFANVYSAEGQVAPLRSPIDYTAIVGSDWENERKTIALSPFVSYRNFGQNQEAWIGLNFRMNYFQIGGSYSSNKDYTIATGLKFNKFKLVYHFDNTQPIYATEQIASHNISIRFNGKLKNARFKK